MRIIIPMAGWGTRLRPHTLTVPKPLIPIAGKPMVQWIAEGLVSSTSEKVEDIAFIIRQDFGRQTEETLLQIAAALGSRGHIFYQEQPLGTAHAILCAAPLLEGNVIIAFADTLFKSSFQIDTRQDGIIFVQQVEDPRPFGVVVLDEQGVIQRMIEKPQEFVSDKAIIGIYYFRDAASLRSEMQYLIDNQIATKGEYQLTDALDRMRAGGAAFVTGAVDEWLDCGNKDATVYTHARVLDLFSDQIPQDTGYTMVNSVVIPPCYIAPGVQLIHSVIGPHVSVGPDTRIEHSVVSNSMIQAKSVLKNKVIAGSMIGNNAKLVGKSENLSVGDFTTEEG